MEAQFRNTLSLSPNRVAEALEHFNHQEIMFALGNPLAAYRDREAAAMKAHFYAGLAKQFKKGATREEKATLQFIRSEQAILKAKLNPGILKRFWYSRPVRNLRYWATGRYGTIHNHKKSATEQQKELTLQHNVSTLSTAFREKGFKHSLEGPLKRMLEQGQHEFFIRHFEISQPDTDYVLHCKKYPGTDVYYFNSFQAISRPAQEDMKNGKSQSQRHVFGLDDELKCNAQQAASLVNGRAIKASGNNWLFLDPTAATGKFPFTSKLFDLLKAIEELPLKIHGDRLEKLIADLQQGKVAQYPRKNGDAAAGDTYRLQADPRVDTIHVMDQKGIPLDKSLLSDHALEQKNVKARQVAEKTVRQDDDFGISLQPAGIKFK